MSEEGQEPVEETTEESQHGDWFSQLSPEAQEEIKKLRSENAKRRVEKKDVEDKLAELQKQLDKINKEKDTAAEQDMINEGKKDELLEKRAKEVEKATADLQAALLDNARLRAAMKADLPEEWLDRVRGNTPEEIAEDVSRLAEMLSPLMKAPEEPDKSEPEKPKPAPTTTRAVPEAGDKVISSDDERRARFFSPQTMPPIFDPKLGGVVNFNDMEE